MSSPLKSASTGRKRRGGRNNVGGASSSCGSRISRPHAFSRAAPRSSSSWSAGSQPVIQTTAVNASRRRLWRGLSSSGGQLGLHVVRTAAGSAAQTCRDRGRACAVCAVRATLGELSGNAGYTACGRARSITPQTVRVWRWRLDHSTFARRQRSRCFERADRYAAPASRAGKGVSGRRRASRAISFDPLGLVGQSRAYSSSWRWRRYVLRRLL